MTEITDNTSKLPPPLETFVLQWGDLGGQWGVNRSISQIHALLANCLALGEGRLADAFWEAFASAVNGALAVALAAM